MKKLLFLFVVLASFAQAQVNPPPIRARRVYADTISSNVSASTVLINDSLLVSGNGLVAGSGSFGTSSLSATSLLNLRGLSTKLYAMRVGSPFADTQVASIDTSGNEILAGDLAVNGGDITSSATAFNFLTSNVTTATYGSATTRHIFDGSMFSGGVNIGWNGISGAIASGAIYLDGTDHDIVSGGVGISESSGGLISSARGDIRLFIGNDAGTTETFTIYAGVTAAALANRRFNIAYDGLADIRRSTTATNDIANVLTIARRSTGNISDGFGGSLNFQIGDNTQVPTSIAQIQAYRDGADNSGKMEIGPYNAGTFTTVLQLMKEGQVTVGAGYGTSPTGVFGIKGSSSFANFLTMRSPTSTTVRVAVDTTGAFPVIWGITTPTSTPGVPVLAGDVDSTAKIVSIGSTNFSNASTAGKYRVSYYLATDVTDAIGGTVTLNLAWNDGISAETYASAPLATTANGYVQDVVYVYLGSGSLSYSTTFTRVAGEKYELRMTCERVK